MIVCPVPQSEYDQEALHRNMEDLAWVEGHAWCHEVILLRFNKVRQAWSDVVSSFTG